MLARSVSLQITYNFWDACVSGFLISIYRPFAVPHFEKMLYDQGQLVNVYLDVFSVTKDVFYSSTSRDILDYLRREMIGPSGEIFSAEDADSAEFEGASRKKEGAFYVWTSQEVYIGWHVHACRIVDGTSNNYFVWIIIGCKEYYFYTEVFQCIEELWIGTILETLPTEI